MNTPTTSLLEYILQRLAESENRYEEYVQQRVNLDLDPASLREEAASADGVTLTAVGVWDVSRDFDYGDGPGQSHYRDLLRATLRLSVEPQEPADNDPAKPRSGHTLFAGRYADGEVTWHEPGQYGTHWLARKPMPVPEHLRAPLLVWPSLLLIADRNQRLA